MKNVTTRTVDFKDGCEGKVAAQEKQYSGEIQTAVPQVTDLSNWVREAPLP